MSSRGAAATGKSGGASSGGGGGAPGSGDGIPSEQDAEIALLSTIAKWTLRESALREQLQKRASQVEASRREEKELRESLKLLSQAFEETRGERYDIVSDFTRQYKATLEELIRVVTTTESTITELNDQQELAKIALLETAKERDHFLALKDQEIDAQNKRIQEMDEEFHIMIDEMQRRMERKVADAVKAAKRAASANNNNSDPASGNVGGGGGGTGMQNSINDSDDDDEGEDEEDSGDRQGGNNNNGDDDDESP